MNRKTKNTIKKHWWVFIVVAIVIFSISKIPSIPSFSSSNQNYVTQSGIIPTPNNGCYSTDNCVKDQYTNTFICLNPTLTHGLQCFGSKYYDTATQMCVEASYSMNLCRAGG